MATIPCPSCGLPRAEDLFGTVPCPLCGHSGVTPPARGSDDEPDSDLPWVIPEAPALRGSPGPDGGPLEPAAPHLAKARFTPGAVIGFLVGVAAGVGGTVSWSTVREWFPGANAAETAEANPTPAQVTPEPPPGRPDAPAVPTPAVGGPAGPEPVGVARPVPAPPPPTRGTVVLGPSPELAPFNPFRPAALRARQLDRVEVYAPEISPGSTLVARGQVKRLIVKGLEAGAVLDCSELDARQVVVVGKIDARSRLAVRAPGGQVTFLSKIDGRSKVDVRAPGGRVVFENPTDAAREGSKIAGGAEVDVAAREVRFVGRITGAGTRVSVTLTAGGALAFAEIEGPSRLGYRQADPADPAPTVVRGTIRGPAVVTKTE